MKKILFLGQYFYPEINSSAALPFDTARFLASHGFEVHALTGYPKEYNHFGKVPERETVENVQIRRLHYLQASRGSRLGRLVNFFSFTLCALFHIFLLRGYDLVLVYSNPPILPMIPLLAKRLFGTPFLFVAYDVYPEVAYPSNSVRPRSMIDRVMRRINKGIYSEASGVVALTEEMRSFLLQHRPELQADRICAIPNWAIEEGRGTRFIQTDDNCNEPFWVTYFGNMGICQDMDTLMDAAALLKDDERIRFLFVGFGSKKSGLEERARREALRNVTFLGHLSGDDFSRAVSRSNCSVVSLERGLVGTCAPSKLYSCLYAGFPVLAIAEPESFLTTVITKEKIGFSVPQGDASALRDRILWMSEHRDECRQMGLRAQAVYCEQYARELALSAYAEWILKCLDPRV